MQENRWIIEKMQNVLASSREEGLRIIVTLKMR